MGLLKGRRARREAHEAALLDYQRATVPLLSAASPEEMIEALGPFGEAVNALPLDEETLLGLKESTIRAYADQVLVDDHLTQIESLSLSGLIATCSGFHTPETIGRILDVLDRQTLADINAGRLITLQEPHLLPQPGEQVFQEWYAALMHEVVQREWVGATRGVSVRIAKGVRVHSGAIRGHSVVTGTTLQPQDDGILSVTSKRVVFLGSRKTSEMLYAKVVGMDLFEDGLRFQLSNRQNALLFHLPRGAAAIAATINTAMHGDYIVNLGLDDDELLEDEDDLEE